MTGKRRLTILIFLCALFIGLHAAPAPAFQFLDFFTAICRNDVEKAGQLCPSGPVLNMVDRSSGATPLTWSSMKGVRPEIADMLLRHGASVNKMDGEGNTPLSTAATCGNAGVALLLLSRGADPNLPDQRGNRPLTLAAGKGGSIEIVRALIAKGVPTDGDDGRKAVDAALAFNNMAIAEYLMNQGARPGYFHTLKLVLQR